jgi:S-DNA-T family DNA segregation ATPase FtsK/SpoIIIE
MPAGLQTAARRLASPQMMARFQTRLTELSGVLLGLAGVALALALATYAPSDPSFDTATTGPVSNIAGHPGADIADLLFQWFGLAGGLPCACLIAWAYRIGTHRGMGSPTIRLAALFAALPASAAVLGGVPYLLGATAARLADWPSPAGIGGATGSSIAVSALAAGRGLLGPLGGTLVWLAGCVLAIILVLLALGLSTQEWRSGMRASSRAPSLPRRLLDRTPKRPSDRATGPANMMAAHPAPTRSDLAAMIEIGGPSSQPTDAVRASAHALLTRGNRIQPAGSRREPSIVARRAPVEVEAPVIALPAFASPGADPALNPPAPQPEFLNAASLGVEGAATGAIDPRPSRFGALSPVRRLLARQPDAQSPPERPVAAARPIQAPASHKPQVIPGWQLPPVGLLRAPPPHGAYGPSPQILQANARLLETVLSDYGVQGVIRDIHTGPVVSLYELEPAPGIRSARVIGLADDIARSLSVTAVRIATVTGRNVIGIEIPNPKRETVFLSELLGSREFATHPARLVLALGKDIGGNPILADLARMPHLLIAGTTGSGKSVGVNAMIASLLYRLSPDECRLILIDPKMLELSVYDGIPHLMAPVVTEPRKAVTALKWTVREMERRYRAMSQLGVRNIAGYNEKAADVRARGETLNRRVQTGFDSETGKPTFEEQKLDLRPLPFLVVIIDEMADLMMVAGKEIETAVQRLAQMARAAGIHVVMATQRPSVDVITGTIKANFPTRISFQVISKFDSRTILGEQGAEQLLGQGDMLYMQGGGRITRVHGPFVEDLEVEEIVAYLKEQGAPDYLDDVTEDDEDGGGGGTGGATQGNLLDETSLFDQAVAIVAREGKASTSFIQRHLNIGYNRAAKLIEQMEKEGMVGPANHVGKREILMRRTQDDD